MGEPQNNRVKFFLKVMSLYDCLGLADVKHLARQYQFTVNLISQDLINEREVVFVGEERFVGRGSEMILQDEQNQLVDDVKLNFVPADNESLVGVVIAVKSNHLAICRVRLENIRQQGAVISVVPLHKLLALGGRDFRPVCQEINLLGELDLHGFLTVGKLVLGAVEQADSNDSNGHEEAPSEVFTLVLEERGELISGGDG